MTSPRPDTRYLATSPITTDLSQRVTNLTVADAGGYENSSTRTGLDGTGNGRSLEASVELDTGSSGTVLDHGTGGDGLGYRITVGSGIVSFYNGASTIATIIAPNASGSLKTYIIGYTTEPNPATTGSGNAMRSVCSVYDVDGDALSYSVVTHAVSTDEDDIFTVGGYWADELRDAYTDTINAVRVSARVHSLTETREHFVALSDAVVVSGIEAVEPLVLPSQATEAGAIVGPQYQTAMASLAPGKNRHRLVGTVIPLAITSATTWQPTLTDVTGVDTTRVRTLSDTYATHLGWLWRVKIPRQCEWILPAVQLATWDTLGSTVAVNLRIYCAAASPTEALEWRTSTLARSTDDGVSGLGVATAFDELLVLRDDDGWSWIWLALSMGSNDRLIVRELVVMPLTKANVDGLPPNEWGP